MDESDVVYRTASGKGEIEEALALCREVFAGEQLLPTELEACQEGEAVIYAVAIIAGKAVGTAWLLLERHIGRFGPVAILKPFRRMGIGTGLLRYLEAVAAERGLIRLEVYVREEAVMLYRTLGYRPVGSALDEAGIKHRNMVKILNQGRPRGVAR